MAPDAPSVDDIELAFYERFFFSRDLEPYPVQEQAFGHIFAGDSVLVTVPTGTGKTMMAKAAMFKALQQGQSAIYTTPLRALTEEKYRELCDDFGDSEVGFATGDYQVNPTGRVQVVVAEILWNRIFGDKSNAPADVVIMDEAHYFNDFERGYVWEQSIIGLDPRTQLVMLSATVGHPDRFCHWVELTRRLPMRLVDSRERRVPLYHEFREAYLIEVVRELAAADDLPAIVFVFGREKCFDTARLLKSCSRFTSDEEKQQIELMCDETLLDGGVSEELRALLVHGIGIHHAGILPRYKQLVEKLALERLIKFVVCTETISAGINLPAKRAVFPSLRKYIRRKARLVTSAEYHQMAGRAGRPQFDSEGIAIVLAPDEIVQDIRKQVKTAKKKGHSFDEEKIRKSVYSKAQADARRRDDVIWDEAAYRRVVDGEPAPLRSHTKITAQQVLAIGLPDLKKESLPGAVLDGDEGGDEPGEQPCAEDVDGLPAYLHLNIATVVDNLLLADRDRRDAHRLLAQVTDNLRSVGVIDDHGQPVAGDDMVRELRGVDGLFVYYAMMNNQFDSEQCRELVELLVDHDVVQRVLDRKLIEARKAWIRERLREKRRESPQITWEDIEQEYEDEHPRELSRCEVIHQEFCGQVVHPQLHGGKRQKAIWAEIEDQGTPFFDFVDRHSLAHEEGSLFSYLTRTMKVADTLYEGTQMTEFAELEQRVRDYLTIIDSRLRRREPRRERRSGG